MNTFCKQDQKDLVCYLQRQISLRDQRIAEQSYDIEQLKNASIINDSNAKADKKIASVQILRNNEPDLVVSTVSETNFSFLFLRVLQLIRHYTYKLPCPVLLLSFYRAR